MRTRIFCFIPLILAGCGVSSLSKSGTSTATSAAASTGGLLISEFYPASGTLESPPTSVQVQFNSSTVNYAQAALASNYTLNCAGAAVSATSVNFTYGSYYATATFASQSASSGTTCYFSVSGNIYDNNGSSLGGTTEQAYLISSSGSYFSWSYLASVSYLSAIGGIGGASFSEAGADGLALAGFNLRVGTYLEGLKGVWMNSTGTSSYGTVHGTSPTTASVSCPSGQRITGLQGYYGTYLNAIGFTCKNSAQTVSSQSSLTGTATGTYFEIQCSAGRFVTAIHGRSGTLVDQIGIGCR